jgi:hypothetical protein
MSGLRITAATSAMTKAMLSTSTSASLAELDACPLPEVMLGGAAVACRKGGGARTAIHRWPLLGAA